MVVFCPSGCNRASSQHMTCGHGFLLSRLCLVTLLVGGALVFDLVPGAVPFVSPRSRVGGAPQIGSFARQPEAQFTDSATGLCRNVSVLVLAACVGCASRRFSLRCASTRRAEMRSAMRAATGAAADRIQLFSPAKVNLFLRVVKKRPDGYHELASLFQTVALGDTMDLEVLPDATKDELECNLCNVPLDDSNFVIRALKLFRDRSGIRRFFRIRLDKKIPAQAGMGGGSSNAAAAFFGANELCGAPGTPADLLRWAEDPIIGSDASFFLSQGTAYCTGRGEIVTPVEPLPFPPDLPVYLVKPSYGLSTPKVFKVLNLSATNQIDPQALLDDFRTKGIDHQSWVNDLESPAFEVSPELGLLKEFISSDAFGFRSVLMSGSGTTIYALGEPTGGSEAFETSVRARFPIEGIWRTHFIHRKSGEEWYTG